MKKSKLLLEDSIETDGVNVYKRGRLIYSPLITSSKKKFSLLVLYARNFDLDKLFEVVNNFSVDFVYDIVVVLSKSDLQKNFSLLGGLDAKIVICPDPEDVLYASLKAGLRAVSNQTDFLVLHFGNLSNVSKETFIQICSFAEISGSIMTIPTFQGKKGHPVVFKKTLLPELMALRKEKGLPYLMRKFAKDISVVAVSDDSILRKNSIE
ncbi:MAG: nucleotidyltransferase family protein [Caldisericaceae bacterium]